MTEFPEDSPRAREDREAEDWLRGELEFLSGAEKRMLRRTRVREGAWRAVAVAFILAIFACCWYLAALSSSSGSTGSACPSVGSTAQVAAGRVLPALRPRAAAGGSGAVAADRSGCS